MPSHKETYQGSLTRGVLNPRDSRADMVFHVTGLDGTRGSLDDAIDSVTGGSSWLVHPDDLTMPLRTATARWVRGADNGSNAEALVYLEFDKRGSGVAGDATELSNLADIDVTYDKILWWGDTLAVPAVAATPEAITLKPDPEANNPAILVPTPNYITIPIIELGVPVVLSSSPISSTLSTVGKINNGSLTLTGTSLGANTVRFNGLRQRVTKIDDGSSVTYEFDVYYSFTIRRDGWYRSILVDDGGVYKADKELMYETATFPTFPV